MRFPCLFIICAPLLITWPTFQPRKKLTKRSFHLADKTHNHLFFYLLCFKDVINYLRHPMHNRVNKGSIIHLINYSTNPGHHSNFSFYPEPRYSPSRRICLFSTMISEQAALMYLTIVTHGLELHRVTESHLQLHFPYGFKFIYPSQLDPFLPVFASSSYSGSVKELSR